ncbi:MAG: hypothetical protein BM556_05085 [Bacteriovorax sp. MedPE-SWde]|nr:MAG: hypothetical protein BM556_05085 [Bacteriovorax sp. MedPE-SWde]
MSLNAKLTAYLDGHHYHYQMLTHVPTETALENAKVLDWPRTRVAKVVACEADGERVLLVLPSNERIHVRSLLDNVGYSHVKLLSEDELSTAFPGCEVGAQPPFASIYGMSLIVSNHFDQNSEVIFNAGNHREAIKLPIRELMETENPKTAEFSVDQEDYDEYRSMYYSWV